MTWHREYIFSVILLFLPSGADCADIFTTVSCAGTLRFVSRIVYMPLSETLVQPSIISEDGKFYTVHTSDGIRVHETSSSSTRGIIKTDLLARSIDYKRFLTVTEDRQSYVFDLNTGQLSLTPHFFEEKSSSFLDEMIPKPAPFHAIGIENLFGSWSSKGLLIYDAADEDAETRSVPFLIGGNYARYAKVVFLPEKGTAVLTLPNTGTGQGAMPELVQLKNWSLGGKVSLEENFPLNPEKYQGNEKLRNQLKKKLEAGEVPQDFDYAAMFKESLQGQYVRDAQISNDGSLVFTSSVMGFDDRHCVIDFFKIPSGQFLQRIKHPSAEISNMALSPDNRLLALLYDVSGDLFARGPYQLGIFDRIAAPDKPLLTLQIDVPFEYPFFWHKQIRFRDKNTLVGTFGDKKIVEITLRP
jgi:hypothetical protein